MIRSELATRVLQTALRTGGDFAELFLEETDASNLKYEDDSVTEANSTIVYGAGLRILKGLQSVYGYTNDLTPKGLKQLARTLAARYRGKPTTTVQPFVVDTTPSRHAFIRYGDTMKAKDKAKLARVAYKAAKGKSPLVKKVAVTLLDRVQRVTVINSQGRWASDLRVRVRMGIMVVASKDGVMETAFNGPGAQMGYEFFDTIDLKAIAKDTQRMAISALSAQECPSKTMDVVIDNGFGGVIFHEACGHSLEATSVAKGLSVFCGKKGTAIANPIVTAVDDGTIPNAWGSGNIDDEGHPTQRNVLIENGILKNYLVDAQNGRRMESEANGCCRRESYKYAPTSRMSNTFIERGTSTKEEIIQATKYGLYAKKMGGGSVNPVTGEFNFAVQEGYLIKNGKIGKPVKGATLVGSGAEILMNIDMIADNLERAQGMCGSSSGSIPADVGQPCLRVRNITVGGRGGN